MRTKAIRDGSSDDGDWVISGQKRFITNAPVADLFVVFARTHPADDAGPGIAVFWVPADTAGVEVGAKDAKWVRKARGPLTLTRRDPRPGQRFGRRK